MWNDGERKWQDAIEADKEDGGCNSRLGRDAEVD